MSERYWDTRMETLPPEQRARFREHRLHWQVRRCWDASPFYRARLEAAGIDPATFGGSEAWSRVPLLRAADLPTSVGDEPSDAWTVAPRRWWQAEEVVGDAPSLLRVLTDGDVIHRADRAARALWAAGARPDETFAVVDDSLAVGLRRIGARAVPGDMGRAWTIDLPYVGANVAHHCEVGDGLHWADDHYLIEVVDPETGSAVPTGSPGALVVTDLTREGSPLLRFWTGSETRLIDEPCRCGRTSARSAFVRPLA